MSLVEADRRRVIRVQSCVRRWLAARRVSIFRQLLHSNVTRIQAGNQALFLSWLRAVD